MECDYFVLNKVYGFLGFMLHLLFDPFVDYGFMRRAIVVCFALSLSSTPIGVFLLLRRMLLIGDALSHAILPGVVIGYFLFDTSVIVLGIGGLISGLLIMVFVFWVNSKTIFQEEASFAGIYLIFLAFGVVLMSFCRSNFDLLNLLFGSILSINICQIKFIVVISSLIFIILSLFYRAFIIEAFDTKFLCSYSLKSSRFIQVLFLFLVVLSLVASFQVVGTLMSIGLMVLPSLSARCWTVDLFKTLSIAICIALLSSWIGLLFVFYYTFLPAGPAIILCNSIIFLFSILFGKYGKLV